MPPGAGHNLAGLDTARDYIHLISTVYQVDFASLFRFVVSFSEIGTAINTPVLELPTDLRYRFMTALSYGVPAVFYLFDGHAFMGTKSFQEKCKAVYTERRLTSNVIHTANTLLRPETWDGFKAVVLEGGHLYFFNSFSDASTALQAEMAAASYGTLEYGVFLIRQGRDDDAQNYLEAYVADRPEDDAALLLLTQLYLRTGQFEAAEDAALTFVDRFGTSNQICLTLASSFEKRQRFREAIFWSERQLSDDPASRDAMMVRARCLEKLGQFGSAADAWQTLVDFGHAPALKLAVRALVIDGQWKQVLEVIERAAPVDNSDGLLEIKCNALYELSRWPEMVEALRTLLVYDQRVVIRTIYKAVVRIEPMYAPLLTSVLAGQTVEAASSVDALNRIRSHLERNLKLATRKGSELDCFAWSRALSNLNG